MYTFSKNCLLIILVLISLSACQQQVDMGINSPTITSQPEIIETHNDTPFTASFEIKTGTITRSFRAAMYHELSDRVYITAEDPNQVIVEESGVTWDDFFMTLPFSLNESCLVTGDGDSYCSGVDGQLEFELNGQLDPQALSKVIMPDDRLMIHFKTN